MNQSPFLFINVKIDVRLLVAILVYIMSISYEQDRVPAEDAALEAQKIIFAPISFQVVRILLELDILKLACKSRKTGLTQSEIRNNTKCSEYGIKVLLEAALALGVFSKKDNRYYITRTGYALYANKINRVNMEVMEKLYVGFSHLEKSIALGKPEGLQVFGDWKTIYEALPDLPSSVLDSWLKWDHFHSNSAFPDAIGEVFSTAPRALLDIGGNTGNWAIACCRHDPEVTIGIVDLPGQLKMAERNLTTHGVNERVQMHPANLLDVNSRLPENYDVIWMSQFLACFSENEIRVILRKVKSVMNENTVLYILEPLWDMQQSRAAAFGVICFSLYFTCFANGNSKMFGAKEIIHLIEESNLVVHKQKCIGDGHTLLTCKNGA